MFGYHLQRRAFVSERLTLASQRIRDVAGMAGPRRRRRATLARAKDTRAAAAALRPSLPLNEKDEHHLRELRVCLRMCLAELAKNRRYASFVKMVDKEDVPDYYEVVHNPMCLDRMYEKVDEASGTRFK